MTGNKGFTIDDLTSYTANNFEDKILKMMQMFIPISVKISILETV